LQLQTWLAQLTAQFFPVVAEDSVVVLTLLLACKPFLQAVHVNQAKWPSALAWCDKWVLVRLGWVKADAAGFFVAIYFNGPCCETAFDLLLAQLRNASELFLTVIAISSIWLGLDVFFDCSSHIQVWVDWISTSYLSWNAWLLGFISVPDRFLWFLNWVIIFAKHHLFRQLYFADLERNATEADHIALINPDALQRHVLGNQPQVVVDNAGRALRNVDSGVAWLEEVIVTLVINQV
jgi:hypothetical protein